MKKQNKNFYTDEKIKEIFYNNIFLRTLEEAMESDVDINHLENIFTDEVYYTAMKIVPLLERKILYLYYVENCRLNDICKRLKLQKNEVIKYKNMGIQHFRLNLNTLFQAEHLYKGGANNEEI